MLGTERHIAVTRTHVALILPRGLSEVLGA